MKRFSRLTIVGVLVLAGCSTLSEIANWAPVADAAFNSIISIADPSQSAVYQNDANGVVAALKDLAVDATAAEAANAGASAQQKVANDLGAVASDLPKVATDLDSIVPAKDQTYVNDAVGVLEAVDAAYQIAIGLTPTSAEVSFGNCGGYQTYADNSIHVWANCSMGDSPVDYVSGGSAAAASPKASAKKVSLGSFKRQWNAIARKDGRPEKQLKLTLAEHLHLK